MRLRCAVRSSRCHYIYLIISFVVNLLLLNFLNCPNRHGFTCTKGSGFCPDDEGRGTGKSARRKSWNAVTSSSRTHVPSSNLKHMLDIFKSTLLCTHYRQLFYPSRFQSDLKILTQFIWRFCHSVICQLIMLTKYLTQRIPLA